MSGHLTDNPERPALVWASPEHPAVALRFQHEGTGTPWRISGFLARTSSVSIGSAWMKKFPWSTIHGPYSLRIIWDGVPTIEHLDEMYDENDRLIPNVTDLDQPRYPYRIDPPLDLMFEHRAPGVGFEDKLAWGEMLQAIYNERGTLAGEVTAEAKRDFFYRTVARIYTAASELTGKPVEAVAQAFEAPKTSAANWVREARVRGHLPATQQGRATR